MKPSTAKIAAIPRKKRLQGEPRISTADLTSGLMLCPKCRRVYEVDTAQIRSKTVEVDIYYINFPINSIRKRNAVCQSCKKEQKPRLTIQQRKLMRQVIGDDGRNQLAVSEDSIEFAMLEDLRGQDLMYRKTAPGWVLEKWIYRVTDEGKRMLNESR